MKEQWYDKYDWLERMDVTVDRPTTADATGSSSADVGFEDDDFKREISL